ncbi:hypothetical protein MKMG_00930 [Methanogenium sp. MK-MG]|nr:hypothetical protein MKMG_00930 [Methanogenium sp. MK-MG]
MLKNVAHGLVQPFNGPHLLLHASEMARLIGRLHMHIDKVSCLKGRNRIARLCHIIRVQVACRTGNRDDRHARTPGDAVQQVNGRYHRTANAIVLFKRRKLWFFPA